MRCKDCGKVYYDSLMLARHIALTPDHERMRAWATPFLNNFRASLKASGEDGARLSKAMNDGWKDTTPPETVSAGEK